MATPLALVTTAAIALLAGAPKVPLDPLADAVNVTDTPLTGLPPESTTVAFKAVRKAALIVALCGVPAVAVTLAGGPARFVREKAAAVATPPTAALTVYAPTVELAVNAGALATPLELVVAVAVAPVPGAANVPLAPLAGAVNVTITPLNKFPPESFTVTCKFVVKTELMATLCGVPAVAATEAGAPAKLVKLKLAGPIVPAVAVTV